ncbi:MAG: hypothetical protein ACI9DC_003612 [Gammaproteobacteria bacterium]|jgi:hypothetical protein
MADAENDPNKVDPDAAKLAMMSQLSLFVDMLLIVGCLYLLVSDITQAVSGMPEFEPRGGAFLVNLSATFALLHRSLALWKRFAASTVTPRPARINVWLIVVLLMLPLSLASGVELLVQHGHRAQLNTLVENITSMTKNALDSNGVVRADHLHALGGPYLLRLNVRTDNGDFLLSAQVPSLGADGLMAHYSSTQRIWHLESFGSTPPASLVFDARGAMLECNLSGTLLNCKENAL